MVGLVIMLIAGEINSKAYCICGHEFNQHYVYPRCMPNPMGTEKCTVCKCKSFVVNPKDKRNA